MAQSKIRPLTESEVTFSVDIEPDDLPLRGNVVASDDDAFDRECEADVQAELDAGNEAAWCVIIVTARWNGINGVEGNDVLGGCSFFRTAAKSIQAQVEECVEEHGMKQEALASLNARIAEHLQLAAEVANKLKVGPVKRCSDTDPSVKCEYHRSGGPEKLACGAKPLGKR